MRSIIINADDYGLTDGVCRSIIALLENEAISNTTIMICVDGAVERCKDLRNAGFSDRAGVHLQMTPEMHHKRPLLPPAEIPTLVDATGFFKPKDHADWINPDEVEREWDRQIVRSAEALGRTPTHIDTHHGRHRLPQLTPVYLKLAAKYGIPARGGEYDGQIDSTRTGVKTSTFCTKTWTGQNKDSESLKWDILRNLDLIDKGVLEVVTHPGFCDDDLMASSGWNTVRENDHNVLLELARSGWLGEMDIKLVRYPDLT